MILINCGLHVFLLFLCIVFCFVFVCLFVYFLSVTLCKIKRNKYSYNQNQIKILVNTYQYNPFFAEFLKWTLLSLNLNICPLLQTDIDKNKNRMANSVDPDEMDHHEPSHLDLHCLQMYLAVLVYMVERVKSAGGDYFLFITSSTVLNTKTVSTRSRQAAHIHHRANPNQSYTRTQHISKPPYKM